MMPDISQAFNITASAGPSALTLSWSALPFVDSYEVRCTSAGPSITDSVCTVNNHTLSLCTNTTSVKVDLLPRTNYTCCVSDVVDNHISDCEEGLVLGGGLSTPVVGAIGAAAGVVVTALVLFVGLIACCACIFRRKNKTKSRANYPLSSVMRTPSQCCIHSKENAGFLRTASQFHSHNRDSPNLLMDSNKASTTTTFTGITSGIPQGNPPLYTPVLKDKEVTDKDVDDMGYLYTSALQVSQRVPSCHNLPPVPRTEEAGQFGMLDHVSLEDTEQYEVMLATASNPAYNNVQHPNVPIQIYEQLP